MPPKKKSPEVKTDLDVILVDVDKLVPNPRNANQHDAEQIGQIAGSMLSFGWTDPIIIWKDNLIIAGHGRQKAAQMIGVKNAPCVDCSHMTENEARAFALAHNRIARNSTFDLDMMGEELRDLANSDFSLTDLGFNQGEIDEAFKGLMEEGQGDDDDRYTQTVESPIYEVTGEKPSTNELFDYDKTLKLIHEIHGSDVPDDVKAFLQQAATRHTVFNYAKIAEFYAHADQPTQDLMERSALVVIDYDKAIENGFVKLIGEAASQYEQAKQATDNA